LVFTDIVDSTTLANGLGDERWIELLLKHFAQARFLMGQFDHHEIKIIADSFMVVFRTAVDALDFVLGLHSDTGDDRIKIRAGIHVGSARILGDDIFGNMVNYTKRVESTDNPAGVRLSDAARNQIADEKAQRHDHLQILSKHENFKGYLEPQKVWVVVDRIRPLMKAMRESIKPIQPKSNAK
jgi:class 3 adenylate cyclase